MEMICNHPRAAVHPCGEGTSHCAWCADIAELTLRISLAEACADRALRLYVLKHLNTADQAGAGKMVTKLINRLEEALAMATAELRSILAAAEGAMAADPPPEFFIPSVDHLQAVLDRIAAILHKAPETS